MPADWLDELDAKLNRYDYEPENGDRLFQLSIVGLRIRIDDKRYKKERSRRKITKVIDHGQLQ